MTSPSLEGLRLALLDGDGAVRRSAINLVDPNRRANSVIESIEIFNARYFGRGTPFTVRFNPWLNAVIGGRGTGKSSLVEFLRLALQREHELPPKLKQDFGDIKRVYQHREDKGLLTQETQIIVHYRKDGSRFRINWAQGSPAVSLFEENTDGSWTAITDDVKRAFPARIYSQKQIFELANEPEALLKIIDESPEVDRAGWNARWTQEETRFMSLRARIRSIQAELANEISLTGQLADIKRKLAVFDTSDHKAVLLDFQLRHKQDSALKIWESGLDGAVGELDKISRALVVPKLDTSSFREDVPTEAGLVGAAEALSQRFQDFISQVAEIASKARDVSRDWQSEQHRTEWRGQFNESKQTYDSLVETLANEGVETPEAYGRLLQEKHQVEQQLKSIQEKKTDLVAVIEDSSSCLSGLCELRRELSHKRADFLNRVLENNKHVRVRVVPYGDQSTVEQQFRRLIGRENQPTFKDDIWSEDKTKGLLAELYEGCDPISKLNADTIEMRMKSLKEKVTRQAEENPDNFTKPFNKHLCTLPPEVCDRIECWFPNDSLDVSYSPTSDGSNFRSIEQGSPGQKTAALLAFLLSYGTDPLVLDQPEDDLDNQLIYSLIVGQLQDNKTRRQILLVTHNPNLVVNGDAELILSLDVHNGGSRVRQGGLQEQAIREEICNVMEGGREAFERRYRRIGNGEIRSSVPASAGKAPVGV